MSAAQSTNHTPSPAPLHLMPVTASARRGMNPSVLLAVIAAGAVGTVGLWWQNTPSISGLGDWLTNAGRITGLLAGYAVVVLLGLMARVPAVERGVGADRLARWHSMGGRYTVSLASAHALLIIWGYAITDRRNVIAETTTLWTQYADVLMATVALGLFVGVGVVSARAVRKRLRYETWLYLHFYTYLATALAFSHQFATGAEFVDNIGARIFWAAMYLGVAGLLIWFRFVTPVRQSMSHNLRVAAVVPETDDVISIWVTGKNIDQLQASPGQFFRWRFLTKDLWWAANPYSLSASPTAKHLRITVKNLGDHSEQLRNLRPGTRVLAEGPYGAMTSARAGKRKTLLIAGGVGVTPMRALFEELSATRRSDVTLVYRASTDKDVLLRTELDAIAGKYKSKVVYAIGHRGSNADITRPGVLQRVVPDLAKHDVYLCGPQAVMEHAASAARSAGVPKRRIHLEDFSF